MIRTSGKRLPALVCGLALLGLLLALAGGRAAQPPAAEAQSGDSRPNIVLIESDDQDLASMRFMPKTNRLIGEKGARFRVQVASWPLCCPARATLFTGQYPHNHGVLGNRGAPLGGFKRFKNETAMPVWLENAGYYTAHIGKYLNGYEGSEIGVPPGWTEWHGSKDTYKFYGYKLLEDGELVQYGDADEDPDNPADPDAYIADVYTAKAVDIIEQRAQNSQPFFLSIAHLAPHTGAPQPTQNSGPSQCVGTAKPAKRHLGSLASEPVPSPPNFNEADTTDKPRSIRRRNPLTDEQLERIDRNFHCRAESLLAIDDSVQQVIQALRETGQLKNTVVIYTSDNGFFHGEHRIPNGKNRVYEEAARVPLLIRGPGIKKGITVDELSINTDLAVTIADLADAKPLVKVDGRSLVKLMQNPDRLFGREALLEQYSNISEEEEPSAGQQYAAIRTHRYKYVENATGERELYDLVKDPYELDNLKNKGAYKKIRLALARRLDVLRKCSGGECRRRPRIKFKLKGEKPRKKKGKGKKRCVKPGTVRATVQPRNRENQIADVTYRVRGKKVGSDRSKPFKTRLRARVLRGKPRAKVDATVMMIDGRGLTVTKTVKLCK